MTHVVSTTIEQPHHDDSASHHPGHGGETLRTYFIIYAALMVLLVITMVASKVYLGHVGNLALAMTIACIKGLLVVLYFMHVRHGSRLVWVFASAAFLWLSILFMLTFADYFTRPYSPSGKLTPELETRMTKPE
jgi:cytochrome c oxidase subunit IV